MKKERSAVTGTTAHPAVSPQEAPSSAANLSIALEPFPSSSLQEAPSSAARLTITLEPCDSNSLG
jgi:hypothetical protein